MLFVICWSWLRNCVAVSRELWWSWKRFERSNGSKSSLGGILEIVVLNKLIRLEGVNDIGEPLGEPGGPGGPVDPWSPDEHYRNRL